MARFKIFIASSSEGLAVAKAIRGHLYHELGQQAEVNPHEVKTLILSLLNEF